MHNRLAIVILNWNGRFLLEQFLPSVVAHSQVPGVSIWIVDNDSTDDSLVWVKEYYPEVNIMHNRKNLGFAGGYNASLPQIQADIYCLLNTDVEVTKGWLDAPLNYLAKNPDCAACQPKILSYEHRNTFEYAGACGGFIDRWGYPFCRGRIFEHCEEDNGQYDQQREIFWASGAALFIRRIAFIQAGGFDERFFAHMEEIDLCWRLQRLGWKIAVVPDAVVYHLGGGTLQKDNPRKVYLNFHNSKAMLAKNLPFSEFIQVWFLREILDDIAFLRELSRGHFSIAWAILKAQAVFIFTYFRWRLSYAYFEKRRKARGMKNNTDIKGIYPHSIVWKYYKEKIRTFSDLPDSP